MQRCTVRAVVEKNAFMDREKRLCTEILVCGLLAVSHFFAEA